MPAEPSGRRNGGVCMSKDGSRTRSVLGRGPHCRRGPHCIRCASVGWSAARRTIFASRQRFSLATSLVRRAWLELGRAVVCHHASLPRNIAAVENAARPREVPGWNGRPAPAFHFEAIRGRSRRARGGSYVHCREYQRRSAVPEAVRALGHRQPEERRCVRGLDAGGHPGRRRRVRHQSGAARGALQGLPQDPELGILRQLPRRRAAILRDAGSPAQPAGARAQGPGRPFCSSPSRSSSRAMPRASWT